jgi:hypothetical protein
MHACLFAPSLAYTSASQSLLVGRSFGGPRKARISESDRDAVFHRFEAEFGEMRENSPRQPRRVVSAWN